MKFANDSLSKHKNICEHSNDEGYRRYDVIYNFYITDYKMTYRALAEKYSVDENTICRDERRAREELSVLMFGADSINDMSK